MHRLIDCHIHTRRCGHATGTAEECVRAAEATGLYGIAITEHLALPDEFDPGRHLSMRADELDDYLAEVAVARREHPGLRIVTGLEADYLPDREAETTAALRAARERADGATFVLGSVHFIGTWAFDDPDNVEAWDSRDIDRVWRDYFSLWARAVKSGLFDVMSHPDLVKKFGHFPSFDPRELYAEAARIAAEAGVLVEVSTAGLRKPVGELYPGAELLAAFQRAGVPATAGSDAHAPSEVGFEIETAYEALARAGYRSVRFPDGAGSWEEIAL